MSSTKKSRSRRGKPTSRPKKKQKSVLADTKNEIDDLFDQHKEAVNNRKQFLKNSTIPYIICWNSGNNHEWSQPDENGFMTCTKCTFVELI